MDDDRGARGEPEPDAPDGGGSDRGSEPEASREGPGAGAGWLGQLQQVIDDLAADASPTVRRLGAQAAELAAVAAERAGPAARRAAELTEGVGQRMAERSRSLAEELRRDADGDAARGDAPAAPPEIGDEQRDRAPDQDGTGSDEG